MNNQPIVLPALQRFGHRPLGLRLVESLQRIITGLIIGVAFLFCCACVMAKPRPLTLDDLPPLPYSKRPALIV